VEEWIRITEIPAPSGMERDRALYLKEVLEAEGVPVSIDEFGNVVATLAGTGGGPTIVIAAHMDTVHPLEVDVTVTRDGDVLRAPGVFDNSASVANMLAVIRAWKRAGIQTRGDVIFIGTVEEEVGLVGMTKWLEANPGVADMVVALDGGLGSVSYGALWFSGRRYIFRADGAHTLQSRGRPHPAVAWPTPSAPSTRSPSPRIGTSPSTTWGWFTAARSVTPFHRRSGSPWICGPWIPRWWTSSGEEMDRRVIRVAQEHGVALERDPPHGG
jgi:hypothetical protein